MNGSVNLDRIDEVVDGLEPGETSRPKRLKYTNPALIAALVMPGAAAYAMGQRDGTPASVVLADGTPIIASERKPYLPTEPVIDNHAVVMDKEQVKELGDNWQYDPSDPFSNDTL